MGLAKTCVTLVLLARMLAEALQPSLWIPEVVCARLCLWVIFSSGPASLIHCVWLVLPLGEQMRINLRAWG